MSPERQARRASLGSYLLLQARDLTARAQALEALPTAGHPELAATVLELRRAMIWQANTCLMLLTFLTELDHD